MATSRELATSGRTASFIPPMALDFSSETPFYRQIATWFENAIASGKLQPGQRVPSTRALAKELKVSRIPVLGAYKLLIEGGYLQTFVGAGTCVSVSMPDALLSPQTEGRRDASAVEPQSLAKRTVSRRALAMSGPARAWMQRCRGCTNLEQFPMAVWSKLLSRHIRKVSPDIMGHGDPMGYGPFREALAEFLGAFRAVKCDASQIMVTTGGQQALQIASLALLDPKDSVWIEEPCYPGTLRALQAAGARLVPVPVDGTGLNVECGIERSKNARAAFVTPSHQMPLGVTMSASRRAELLGWAARNGAWIIEDDYDSEYRFRGSPPASLQGLDRDGRVIYVGTLAEAMFPALRLGYLVIPQDLIQSFLDVRNTTDTLATSVLYQMAMTDFIREGHFSRHLRRMREVYKQARNALAAAVAARMGGLLEMAGDEAGMRLLALLPAGIDDVEIATKCPKTSATIYPLSECYMSPPQRGGLMIGYANLDADDIPELVKALKSLVTAKMRGR
ncbi:MAG TPA: PLP-dependent aminotransferase family protein [Steroidobacteraceae bacterium]|nr:PLP-dependent aminotransferase family protein [Steroidobacteraceae bacterium]